MTWLHDKLVKHWSENNGLMDKYWNNPDLISGSKALAKIVEEYKPKSIYEVGMYNGRNLKYMSELMPDVKLGGIDVNPKALEFAKIVLPKSVSINHGDVLNMDTSEKYDIVFTHGVLMHISPEVLFSVADKIIDKANKYIVHIEREEQNNNFIRGPDIVNPEKIDEQLRWAPNIPKLYELKGQMVLANDLEYIGSRRRKSSVIIIKKVDNV